MDKKRIITEHLNSEKNNIKKLLEENYSVQQICEIYNYSYTAIYNCIKRNNLYDGNLINRNGKYKKQKDSQNNRIKIKDSPEYISNLYWKEEYNLYDLAKLYNTNPATVLNFFKKHNISRRSKSNANILRIQKDPNYRDYMRNLALQGHTGYAANKNRESWIEKACREWLESNNVKFEQEYQIMSPGHFYDFRVGDYLIEMDGVYWHEKPEQKIKDIEFENIALQNGYYVIRITDKELKDNGNSVFDDRLGFLLNE